MIKVPKVGRGPVGAGGPSGRGGRPRKPARGRRGAPGPTAAEKEKVAVMVQRSGIAAADALRVVRGRVTLNEVLERMFLRQRVGRLVKEGLRCDLAGQVVRGRLPPERALQVQELWNFQQAGWKVQRWKEWPPDTAVGLFCYGRDPFEVRLRSVERYDLLVEGPEGVVPIPKDQVVAYCRAEDLATVRQSFASDAGLEDLGRSRYREDRWRPTLSDALAWVRQRRPVRFRLRNGQAVQGLVRRVAFYEIELEIQGGRLVLMTHALRQDVPFEVG